MASIHRHSSGRSKYWYAKFRAPNGTSTVKSTKTTDRQKALAIALEYEKAARKADAGALSEAQARKVVSEIFEIAGGGPISFVSTEGFMTDWLEKTRLLNAPGTVKRYERTIRDFLQHLGPKAKRSIAVLSPSDIDAYLLSESAQGKTSVTCNMAIKTLRIPLNIARRHGLISVNPAEVIELLPSDGEERECFSPEQVRAILNAADRDWRGLTLLGYYTGARLGVVANLTWENADRELREFRFKPNKIRKGKKVSSIVCPIHPELRDFLMSMWDFSRNGPILPSLAGRPLSGKTGLSESFQNLMVQAGIDVPRGRVKTGKGRQFRRLGFHSLRHSFNTGLANRGVSQEIRRALIGHASDATNERYTHFSSEVLMAAVKKIPRLENEPAKV
jgi:integrase